ncbi:MAG: DUF2974 domain-containing protein [Bacilli bacterium]|nr:DUF2974 domain-containing protein [Bacilli bacterium]
MNIIGYIKAFGHLSFIDKSFNNVDALILTILSYLNFELLKPSNKEKSLFIKDIPDDMIVKLCDGEFITKSNEKIIRLLKYKKRYQDISIKYIHKVHDKLNTIQFFAITLIVPNYHPFICFRGTDLTLVGWKEDLMLAIRNVVPSQIEALNYVNYVSKKINGTFSLCGHSKGGNLAMFTSIQSRPEIQRRIDKAYVFDGPGFRNNKIFYTNGYQRVKNKIIQFVPRDDIVGCLFHTPKNKLVVKAKSVHFLQHNPYTWVINKNDNFKFLEKESRRVKIRRRTLILWIDQLSIEECEFMIEKIINALGGINSSFSYRFRLLAIKFRTFIGKHFGYSKATRKRLSKSALLFMKIWSESQIYYLKHPNEY